MKVGEQAVDAAVTLSDGTRTSLGALWGESPLALVFLRHFG